jgi:hypothetical protein
VSIYKVLSESQIKRLRQLGYVVVPVGSYRFHDATDHGALIDASDLGPADDVQFVTLGDARLVNTPCPIPLDSAPAPQNGPQAGDGPATVSDSPEAPESSPAPNLGDLEARHRGNGSYSIMRGDEELVEGLDKGQAAAFNAASPGDQAEIVTAALAGK